MHQPIQAQILIVDGVISGPGGKIYLPNARGYTQLLKTWISWAVANDIPCDGLGDLPNAHKYIQMSTTEKSTGRSESGGGEK